MYDQSLQKTKPVKPSSAPTLDDNREVTLDEWDDIVADKYQVPRSLMKSVRSQESGGNVNAVSPTGVRGRYQVTEATAKIYGLDRNDPWQQSVAAAKHLRKMYEESDGADDDEKWLSSVGKYYGGPGAVKNGVLSGDSVDGVSNPAEHVRRVAEKWGEFRRNEVSSEQPAVGVYGEPSVEDPDSPVGKPMMWTGPETDADGRETSTGMVTTKPAGVMAQLRPIAPRARQAAAVARQIEGLRKQSVELFRQADQTPADHPTGFAQQQELLRAQAEGKLASANELARRAQKQFADHLEIGFGKDSDPNSKREWAYAKLKTPKGREESDALAIEEGNRRRFSDPQGELNQALNVSPEAKSRFERQRQQERQQGRRIRSLRGTPSLDPVSRAGGRIAGYLRGASPQEMEEAIPRMADVPVIGAAEDISNRIAGKAIRGAAGFPEGLARFIDRQRNRGDLTTAETLQTMLATHPEWSPEQKAAAQKRIRDIYANQSAIGDTFEGLTRAGEGLAKTAVPVDSNKQGSINPLNPNFYSVTLPKAAGSMLPFMAGGMAGAAAKVPVALTSGVLGVGMSVPEQYQEAKALGASPEQLARAVDTGTLAGLIEALGAKSLMGEVAKTGRRFVPRVLGEGVKESGQEALQSGVSDLGAKYNERTQPNLTAGQMLRNAAEQAVPAAFLGAAGGLGSSGVAQDEAIATRKERQPLPVDIRPTMTGPTQISSNEQLTAAARQLAEEAARKTARIAPQQKIPQALIVAANQSEISDQSAASPAAVSAATPVTSQSSALLFPEAIAPERPDLSLLSPEQSIIEKLARLREAKEGKPLEETLNKDFAEASAMVGSAAQNWDVDRPVAELMAATGAQRLKSALQNLQKSEPYIAELAAVSQGVGQPGPYIAAAQQIQQQLDQADNLFRLDAERERQAKELQAEAEKAQKKAEKEIAKQAKFEAREQLKLDREIQVEQRRAEIQQRRDDATAKRMQVAEMAKNKRRMQLEEQRQQSRDAKVQQRADVELQRLARHDAALQAADSAGQRHQEYLNQGMVPEAINELIVQQNQLRDAVRLLPATPESQNIKADLNRYQGQIGNRIGDLRKQASGKTGPITEAIPPLLRSDAVVNKDGGVPELPSLYEPGAIFDKLNPSLGDVEESSTPLLTAVRRAGGISNDEISPGELRRLGIKESGTTGLVNNRGGLAPDRMREAMVEAGYLAEDSTVDDLFQAIEGELRAGQRRSQPQESIADFYDRWEAEQSDAETGERGDGESRAETSAEKSEPQSAIRNPQSSRQSIEEFADDVKADDLEALQRAISRSQRDNPRPYGERTRPGEPGSGLVSFSQYAELEARNPEQEQVLYNNEPTSETFQDAVDWITEDAAKAGIGQNHVDAMVAYALNWHGEKAFWESQGLSIETTQQAVEDLDASIRGDLRRIAALPDIYRTAVESEIAALDSLFDDADAVNLLERAARGEDNAVNEFTEYAQQYALSSDTISGLVEARRPADPKRSLVKNAESQSDTRNTGSRPASSEKRKPVRLTRRERELLGASPSEIRDEEFDRHLMTVEDIWARAVRGEVDIDPQRIYNPAKWAVESEAPPRGAGVLAQLRAERSRRRDENRLPARENLTTINRYMDADLSALAAPKKEGRKSRLQEILDATRITIEKNPSGAPAGWMEQVRDLDKRAKIAQASYEARIVSHPNPAIDGKPILAETEDGRVIVANPENLSGVSIVKNRNTQQNPENAIIPEQNAVSGRSSQAGSEVAADDDRLGKRSLSGSERGAGPDQRTAAEAGVSGLPAGSRRSDAGAGSLGTDRADQPTGSGGTAPASAKFAEPGRSAQQNNLSQSDSPRSSGEDRRVPGQRPGQPGQSKGATTGAGNEPGRLAERADQAIQRGSRVEWDNRGIKRSGQVLSVKDGVATVDVGFDVYDTVPLGKLRIAERRAGVPFTDRYTVHDLAANATAQYRPARNRPGTVYLNEWGHALVRDTLVSVYDERVSGIPGDFTLNTASVRGIADKMRDRASGAFAGIAKELETAADDADANGRDIAIVTQRQGQSIGEIKRSVRHETIHAAQSAVDPVLTGAATQDWLGKQPKSRQIRAELERRGYDSSTFGYEAVAYVASGEFIWTPERLKREGRADSLPHELSLDEAVTLMDSYYRATVQKFGASALEKFGAIDPKLQPSLERIRYETQSGRAIAERAAENAGAGSRGAQSPTRQYRAGAFGQTREGQGGTEGVPRVAERKSREGRRSSFGELETEPSGTVLGSGLGGLQDLLKRRSPVSKPAEKTPIPKDFDLLDWSETVLNEALVSSLPAAAKEAYAKAKTRREKQAILSQNKLDSAIAKGLLDAISSAEKAIGDEDGAALRLARSEASLYLSAVGNSRRTPAPIPETASAEEYFQREMRRSPFKDKPDRLAKFVSEEVDQTIKDAAKRFKEGKIDDAHLSRVLTAADVLLSAGRLGDPEAIQEARKDLRTARRNLAEASTLKRGSYRVFDLVKQAASISQTLRYGSDWSFMFRQGGAITLNPLNTLNTLRSIKYAYHATAREGAERQGKLGRLSLPSKLGAEGVRDLLEQHPRIGLARQSGLELALDGEREEVYKENIATRLPWIKRTEAGNGAMLDYLRLQEFGRYAKGIEKNQKYSPAQRAVAFAHAAEIVNTLTGRTNLGEGRLKKIADVLNGFFGAPRLTISRLKMADPTWIARQIRQNPTVGAQLAKDAAVTSMTIASMLTLGAMAGLWATSFDPDDSEFLKIRIGDTRYDMTFGMTPILKLFFKAGRAAYLKGEDVYLGTDQTEKDAQKASDEAVNEGKKFLRGRLGPLPSYIADLWFQKDFVGRPVNLRQIAEPMNPNSPWRRLAAPLSMENTGETLAKDGIVGALKTTPFELFGLGVNTYADREGRLGKTRSESLSRELKNHGLTMDRLNRKPGEPDTVYRQRVERVEGWLQTYGEKLISNSQYKSLSGEQKRAALESLRLRIGSQQNMKRPSLDTFDAESIIRSVKRSAASKPRRDAKQLWVPQ